MTLSDLADTHGLVECKTCRGSGKARAFKDFGGTVGVQQLTCPSCVSGWTVDPEVVEVVAFEMHCQDEGEQKALYYRDQARAGLLAYLTHIEERL